MNSMARTEIITRCVDDILEGRTTLEGCVTRYPELREELTACLAMARLVAKGNVVISPEFKTAARARLFREEQLTPLREQRRCAFIYEWLKSPSLAFTMRASSVALAVVLWLTGSGATVVYASQSSLPGEVLYPVKISSEKARLALTPGLESKAILNIQLADRRVGEAVAQTALGQDISANIPQAVGERLDAAILAMARLDDEKSKALISRLSEATIKQQAILYQALSHSSDEGQKVLEESIDTSRRGSTVAVVANINPAFLDSTPSVRDGKLDQMRFRLEGTLQATDDGKWNVGGISLTNVMTSRKAPYPIGNRVTVEGLVNDGKTFIFRIDEEDERDDDDVTIEGVFTGAGENGNTWYVSGISIGRADNTTGVPAGTILKLGGMSQNGVLSVNKIETYDNQKDVRVTGKLIDISEDSKVVVIEVAGARIEANMANTVAGGGENQGISTLRSQTGKDITISGLKSKGGVLYADNVSAGGDSVGKRSHQQSDEDQEESDDEDRSSNSTRAGQENADDSGDREKTSTGDSGDEDKKPTGDSQKPNNSPGSKQNSQKPGERQKDSD